MEVLLNNFLKLRGLYRLMYYVLHSYLDSSLVSFFWRVAGKCNDVAVVFIVHLLQKVENALGWLKTIHYWHLDVHKYKSVCTIFALALILICSLEHLEGLLSVLCLLSIKTKLIFNTVSQRHKIKLVIIDKKYSFDAVTSILFDIMQRVFEGAFLGSEKVVLLVVISQKRGPVGREQDWFWELRCWLNYLTVSKMRSIELFTFLSDVEVGERIPTVGTVDIDI